MVLSENNVLEVEGRHYTCDVQENDPGLASENML